MCYPNLSSTKYKLLKVIVESMLLHLVDLHKTMCILNVFLLLPILRVLSLQTQNPSTKPPANHDTQSPTQIPHQPRRPRKRQTHFRAIQHQKQLRQTRRHILTRTVIKIAINIPKEFLTDATSSVLIGSGYLDRAWLFCCWVYSKCMAGSCWNGDDARSRVFDHVDAFEGEYITSEYTKTQKLVVAQCISYI